MKPCLTRRALLPAAAAAVLASCQKAAPTPFAGTSPVAVLKAKSYQEDLVSHILTGIRLCGLQVKDADGIRSVLVEIAEGPGHRRDTLGLADEAGYWKGVKNFEDNFVDLNRDDVSPIKNFAGQEQFFFPNTVLAADLIVSMPKMKTHHWAGTTLSMKNFFGLVPGAVYGWPKNTLHYIGIAESIVALNRQFRQTFAIVDGIVGMEGNGPIQGTPKTANVLVFGKDLVAVDATCCRIMGIDPAKIEYLTMSADFGATSAAQIQQRGENPAAVRTDFQLMQQYQSLRLA
ncbi:MAG: DUF362 domain-containing protein [Acidobacteria bacterium]|nr:DUF362 domain-containing protein [Acidobacteriota bacterium]